METLEKLIYDLYKKNARQCTDEEIYNALLIYTKNQLFERGYQDGKKKIYYISAEFLIGKLLSNNLINLGIYGLKRCVVIKLPITVRNSRICRNTSFSGSPL